MRCPTHDVSRPRFDPTRTIEVLVEAHHCRQHRTKNAGWWVSDNEWDLSRSLTETMENTVLLLLAYKKMSIRVGGEAITLSWR